MRVPYIVAIWVVLMFLWMALGSFVNWNLDQDKWIWGAWLNRAVMLFVFVLACKWSDEIMDNVKNK